MSDKKRQPNFTGEERVKFIRCVKKYPIVLCKKTDGPTNAAKEKAWEELAIEFNSIISVPRTVSSIRKLWERMKSEAKQKYASYKQELYKTGNGVPVVPLDPITNTILAMLKKSGIGIDKVNDSIMNGDYNTETSKNQNSIEILEITPDIDETQSSSDSYLPSDSTQSLINNTSDLPTEETDLLEPLYSIEYQDLTQNKNDVITPEDNKSDVESKETHKRKTWFRSTQPILFPDEQSAAAKLFKKYADCTVEKVLVEEALKALIQVELQQEKELHAARLAVEHEKKLNLVAEREQKKALFEVELAIKKKILQKIETLIDEYVAHSAREDVISVLNSNNTAMKKYQKVIYASE